MSFIKRYWKGLAWFSAIVVIIVCSLPTPQVLDIQHIDKLEHAIAFGGICGLFFFAYPNWRFLVYIGSFLLGLAVELLQAVIPWRSAEMLDLVADGVGVILAIVVIELFLVPRMRRRGLMK
ncbi:VanZ family protein [uncultured Umboniibacter sp.]|uniref:VanZ family protein n=1 Tax=uncultured Umboniibacter sp. TaxID=1798917 RepID=UPI0026084545|nr:VanZ family protein [uncultured Umboniibacter sp.]